MLRMADLGKQDGRAHLSEGVAEAENEATSEVDLPVGGEARDQGTSNHDSAASGDWDLTANSLGEEGYEEEADDGTDIVRVVHETEAVLVGVVEVDSPATHLLGGVHHHTSASVSNWTLSGGGEYIPIVTCGGRSNTQNTGMEVQLAHVWQLLPVDLLELGGIEVSPRTCVRNSRHREKNVTMLSTVD
jgi:hypothetical protein